MDNISLDDLKLIIFDVDGTLYDQSKLRKRMFFSIIKYYLVRPWRLNEILIIYHFRKEREKKHGFSSADLVNDQYRWCADKTNIPLDKVKKVIDKWIFDFPNQYLETAMFPDVRAFFHLIENKGILRAVYSDYDAKVKMEKMQLSADFIVSSTDVEVNAFKPLPNGINYILAKLNINNKANCLFIGDRPELDGACANNAGIPFLLVDKTNGKNNFYTLLLDKVN